MDERVVTRNTRISVAKRQGNLWQLTIRDVKPSDQGWYMCQINTDPMISQRGFLEVTGQLFFKTKRLYDPFHLLAVIKDLFFEGLVFGALLGSWALFAQFSASQGFLALHEPLCRYLPAIFELFLTFWNPFQRRQASMTMSALEILLSSKDNLLISSVLPTGIPSPQSSGDVKMTDVFEEQHQVITQKLS